MKQQEVNEIVTDFIEFYEDKMYDVPDSESFRLRVTKVEFLKSLKN